MVKALESVKEFALVAFVLLGVLFGMMIMNFIFGVLGPDAIGIPDDTVTIINETGANINRTGYTISAASLRKFNGGFTVLIAYNTSSVWNTIAATNYTVNAETGEILNATAWEWNNVSLVYTYNSKTSSKLAAENVQNNSLEAIVTYSEGASTQFSTITIAIVLALLIAVFLLFWKIFVSDKGGKGESITGGTFG